MEPIISIQNVSMRFNLAKEKHESLKEYFIALTHGGVRFDEFFALSDVSFSIYEGESLGLVGESGCGKTSLSKAALGMTKDIRGEIVHFTSHPQMIFQDPYSSLNPSKTVGWLLEEPLRAAAAWDKGISMTKEDRRAAAYDMLHKVGLDD